MACPNIRRGGVPFVFKEEEESASFAGRSKARSKCDPLDEVSRCPCTDSKQKRASAMTLGVELCVTSHSKPTARDGPRFVSGSAVSEDRVRDIAAEELRLSRRLPFLDSRIDPIFDGAEEAHEGFSRRSAVVLPKVEATVDDLRKKDSELPELFGIRGRLHLAIPVPRPFVPAIGISRCPVRIADESLAPLELLQYAICVIVHVAESTNEQRARRLGWFSGRQLRVDIFPSERLRSSPFGGQNLHRYPAIVRGFVKAREAKPTDRRDGSPRPGCDRL